MPRCNAVFAFDHYVQDVLAVFQHPCDERVVHRNKFVNPVFGAYLDRPESAAYEANADFGEAIALRIVCGLLLFADLL